MADVSDYESIVIVFTPKGKLLVDTAGGGEFEILFNFPGTYKSKAQLFLQFPQGVNVNPASPPSLSPKDTSGARLSGAFSGHPTAEPYTPHWVVSGTDPVLLVSEVLSNEGGNQFKVAVKVSVNLTHVARNAKIKAWVLDEAHSDFDPVKTKHQELAIEQKSAAELKIKSVVNLAPGYKNAAAPNVWWVKKGTPGTMLTVEAHSDLTGSVFLHWQGSDTQWHALSHMGQIDSRNTKIVTFDLSVDSTLEALIRSDKPLQLNIGLRADSSTATGPMSPANLSIHKEAATWLLEAASARFDTQGKLQLEVHEKSPATSSGVMTLEYSVNAGARWDDFKPGTAFDAGKHFPHGIQVRAKSNLKQESAVINAKINATDIYSVTWPTYQNAKVDSPLPFNVTVTAKNTLILPIEQATVTLPLGMTLNGKQTFDFGPAELNAATFSHHETVAVSGPAGASIGKAKLELKSAHFTASVVIVDPAAPGQFKPGVTSDKDKLAITVPDHSPVTNSTKPFVDVTLTPPPANKTVHIQYQDGKQWKDIPSADVHKNTDGTFRVSLPERLIRDGKITGLKLRAKTGGPSTHEEDFGDPNVPINVAIKDDTPVIKSVVIVKDTRGHLVARVTVHNGDATNPVVNVHIHKEGDAAANRPENWESHNPPNSSGDHTIDIPIPDNDLRHIKVEVVNKAGVPSGATAARIEQYHEVFDVQFKLDGTPMAQNAASNVKAGEHTLEVTVTPQYHLSSYHLDGFLGPKGHHDTKLLKKSAPVVTGGAALDQHALSRWNGNEHAHLLVANEVSSAAGAPQRYTLTFGLAFVAGQKVHEFEVRVSEGNAPGHTDSSPSNEGIYRATFNMAQ